jgi:hypothetical protein
MEQGTRTRLATIFILFLVLVSGSVLGIAVDRHLEARAAVSRGEWRGPGGRRPEDARADEPGEDAAPRRRLIVEQVGLDEAQKAQVDSIVAHYREKMRGLQEELQAEIEAAYTPRYRGLVEETRDRIKAVLSPAQRVMYDSLLVEHDHRRGDSRRERDTLPGPR